MKITLNWDQAGLYDAFSIYRNTSQLDIESLPAPIKTGLTAMRYVDTDIIEGETYFYLVAVLRGSSVLFSEQVSAVASSDPNAAFLVNDLVFTDSNLVDTKTGTSWVLEGASYSFVDYNGSKAISLGGATSFYSPQNLSSASDWTIEFDIKLNSIQNTSQAGLLFIGSINNYIRVYTGNDGADFSVEYYNWGDNFSDYVPSRIHYNTDLRLKFVKISGKFRVYINNELKYTSNQDVGLALSRVNIAKRDRDPNSNAIAIIDNVKVYEGIAIV